MPQRIVELELWSLPRAVQAPFDGKAVALQCRTETGLASTVVLGLSLVPDAIDVQNLRTALTLGELREDDFTAFCAVRNLEPNLDNLRSACEFLAYAEGQALAWLHLPEGEAGLHMAHALVGWASRNGMQLHDGGSTYEPLSEDQVYARWPQ